MNPTLFRFASSAAMCLTMAGVLAAQSTSPPTGTSQADQSRTQGRDNGTVTVAGCLMQEKDVAALRSSGGGSGSGDAFVLTNATMKGSTSGSMGSGATGTGTTGTGTSGTATSGTGTSGSGTSGTGTTASGSGTTSGTSASGQATAGSGARSGMNNMFRIVGLTDELKKHVNHQVEIQGTIANRSTTSGAGSMGSGSGTTGSGSGTATGTGTGTTGTGTATGTTGSTGTGTAGSTGGTSASGQTGRQMGSGNAAELRATSVRMISATCPTSQQ